MSVEGGYFRAEEFIYDLSAFAAGSIYMFDAHYISREGRICQI